MILGYPISNYECSVNGGEVQAQRWLYWDTKVKWPDPLLTNILFEIFSLSTTSSSWVLFITQHVFAISASQSLAMACVGGGDSQLFGGSVWCNIILCSISVLFTASWIGSGLTLRMYVPLSWTIEALNQFKIGLHSRRRSYCMITVTISFRKKRTRKFGPKVHTLTNK